MLDGVVDTVGVAVSDGVVVETTVGVVETDVVVDVVDVVVGFSRQFPFDRKHP